MNDQRIKLVTVLGTIKDNSGFKTDETSETEEIFAGIKSVGRAEYYEAMSRGVKVSIIFEVDPDDFALADRTVENGGQTRRIRASGVIHEDVRYRIVRTYRNRWGMLELTCGEEE